MIINKLITLKNKKLSFHIYSHILLLPIFIMIFILFIIQTLHNKFISCK